MLLILLAAAQGYVLSPGQLRNIKSVACLQLLHRDPTADCGRPADREAPTAHGDEDQGQWFIGSGGYPVPDAVLGQDDPKPCSSDGEYFCDPDAVLTPEQQEAVRADIRFVRENNLVSCPLPGLRARAHAPGAPRPGDELDFLLGVAIMRTLPTTELDDDSLQKFGESVMDGWKLNTGDCDRAAVLVVVAEAERVWLATPTCRFFCGAANGEPGAAAALDAGQRILGKLQADGDWGGRLQAATREISAVLHRGAERSREMPKDSVMAAYLRRKEKEWRQADAAMQWAAVAVMLLAAVSILLWHWQWVKEAVPYGAGKLAEDDGLGWARAVYLHVAALVLIVPLLLYWGVMRGLQLLEALILFVMHSAFGVATAAWAASTACLASVTEPCFNLLPAEQTAEQAVESLDAFDVY